MTDEHPSRDDLVAFSLGALEPEEKRRLEGHVPGCARCARELEALVPAVAVLGESVEQLEPPPELRERVLAVVHAEADAERQTEPVSAPPRSRLRRFALRPAIGLAALAIAAAGVAGYLIHDNGGGGTSTVPVEARTGAGGSLVVGEIASRLDLHDMAPLSHGEVYQAWVADGPNVRPSSNFIPDSSGRATTAIDGRLHSGERVLVTRESAPGHTKPTPPVLLSATVD
jgi:anti-sigma-K factor RskA